ncbi:hypothetical protein [Gemmata algarum]
MFECLAARMSVNDILSDFPDLMSEETRARLAFAADS